MRLLFFSLSVYRFPCTYFQCTKRNVAMPFVIYNRSEADQRRVTRRFQIWVDADVVVGEIQKDGFVEGIGRGASSSSESASSRPWKYFFVRVTRVPSPAHRGTPFWARPTKLFARGQTSRRGLPGNCWKHLASVYSVIETRSHLGNVQVLWKPVS